MHCRPACIWHFPQPVWLVNGYRKQILILVGGKNRRSSEPKPTFQGVSLSGGQFTKRKPIYESFLDFIPNHNFPESIYKVLERKERHVLQMENKVQKIKGSRRGLTFSFVSQETDFIPGTHYRYAVYPDEGRVVILPSTDGGNTVSKKKVGLQMKSLIDLRSKEIRELTAKADRMEIEFCDGYIEVSMIAKAENQICAVIGKIAVAPQLAKAAGCEAAEFVQSKLPRIHPWTDERVHKEIPDVIRTISLFSGAGMLDYAFAKDPCFEIVYAAEYAHDAVTTYRGNIGDHIHECDIRSLHGSDFPKADLMIGGPPCQPFSAANRHDSARGDNHPEGDMFKHYLRLIRESGVKAFLIENVPALLSDKGRYYLDLIRHMLPDFTTKSKLITDCDVGGYTKRKRAIIIGSRIGEPMIPELFFKPARTVGDALRNVDHSWPNAEDITVSSETVKRKISMIPEGGNWRDLPEEYWTKVFIPICIVGSTVTNHL